MDDSTILQIISKIIEDGTILSAKLYQQYEDEIDDFCYYKDFHKFQKTAENILRIRFGSNSIYYSDFLHVKDTIFETENINLDHSSLLDSQIGILESIVFAIENNLTEDLFYQKELLVFSDMLDQAFDFLDKKLDFAAAMYGRVVLETTIKEFAKKNDIDTNRKFDQIIIDLRKKDLIHKPLENSLRSNYEIGTWGAHGDKKFNTLTSNHLYEFLCFIQDKVLTLE